MSGKNSAVFHLFNFAVQAHIAVLLSLGMFVTSVTYAKLRKAPPPPTPTPSASPSPKPKASSSPVQRHFSLSETLLFEAKKARKQGNTEKAKRLVGRAQVRDKKIPIPSWMKSGGKPLLQQSPPTKSQLLKTARENMEATTQQRLESYLQRHPGDREVRAALLAKAIKDENARDIQRHQSILTPGKSGKPAVPYWPLILLGGLWGAIAWQLFQIYRDQGKE